MKMLFDVTVHNRKHGGVVKKAIIASNDAVARQRAVSQYVNDWNKPYKDDETGKMVKAEQISERDLWCDVEMVRKID